MLLLSTVITFFYVRLSRLSIILLLLLNIAGCGQFNNFSRLPIAQNFLHTQISSLEIPKNIDSNVYLKGKVSDRSPFLEGGAYQLDDSTGKIWIITTNKLPSLETEIAIEGTVRYQSIPIENREWGELYMIQEEKNN
jgi:hypothetical protein